MRVAFIYGLFYGKVCVYIGQTVAPTKRKFHHLKSKNGKFYKRRLKFRIIRQTILRDVSRLEKQIGSAYKRKGQAAESSFFGGTPPEVLDNQNVLNALLWNWDLSDSELAVLRKTSRVSVCNVRNKIGIHPLRYNWREIVRDLLTQAQER